MLRSFGLCLIKCVTYHSGWRPHGIVTHFIRQSPKDRSITIMYKKSERFHLIETMNGYFSVKFIYSEKTKKFCEIIPLLLTVGTVVKSKGKISQNFVAFSEYMNFNFQTLCHNHKEKARKRALRSNGIRNQLQHQRGWSSGCTWLGTKLFATASYSRLTMEPKSF